MPVRLLPSITHWPAHLRGGFSSNGSLPAETCSHLLLGVMRTCRRTGREEGFCRLSCHELLTRLIRGFVFRVEKRIKNVILSRWKVDTPPKCPTHVPSRGPRRTPACQVCRLPKRGEAILHGGMFPVASGRVGI
jgi:hypothetical protein